MANYYYLNTAIDIYEDMKIGQIFHKIMKDEHHSVTDNYNLFQQRVSENQIAIHKQKNSYINNSFMWTINIPYRYNESDQYTKSFQFVKGYAGFYTIKIVNIVEDRELFVVSGIDENTYTGELGIKFNKDIDKNLGDPRIKSGTDLISIGMAICYIMGVRNIKLGDQATVLCDGNSEYILPLSLMKRLNGDLGFYEKQGFKLTNNIDILIETIREANTHDVLIASNNKPNIPNMKVRDYVKQIMTIEGKKGDKLCEEFSNFLVSIQNPGDCNYQNPRIKDLCIIMKDLKRSMSSQIKELNYDDVFKVIL